MNEWALTEDQIRAKLGELLEGMSPRRLNVWLTSGINAGVLDESLVHKVFVQEMDRCSSRARLFWITQYQRAKASMN